MVSDLKHHLLAIADDPRLTIVADTESYRRLAASQVCSSDHVIEIGSCLGHCTSILFKHAASVIGFDVSQSNLSSCRSRFPNIRFEFLDIFEEPQRLRDLPEAACVNIAFLDIGGDRKLSQVLHAIELLLDFCLPHLRLLTVKSEELQNGMMTWGCEPKKYCGEEIFLHSPTSFLRRLQLAENDDENGFDSARACEPYSLCQQKKKTARCNRAATYSSPVPGRTVALRSMIEKALPRGHVWHSGVCLFTSCIGIETVMALVLTEHNQPLVRHHAAVCIYGDEEFAKGILRRTAHPIPVFLGPGGAEAPYEFLGTFKASSVLPRIHQLYDSQAFVSLLQTLAKKSRRNLRTVQLVQLHRIDDPSVTSPKHPLEVKNPIEWVRIMERRTIVADCLRSWSHGVCRNGESNAFERDDF